MKLIRDTWLVFQRQSLLQLRQPIWIVVGIFQPAMYLLLFTPMLKPALEGPLGLQSTADVYGVFVPGLLILIAVFGGLFQGFSLIAELRAGIIERSRVTVISRLALLLGRSLRDATVLIVQAALLTALALLFGLVVRATDLLLTYLMLVLLAVMTSAASYGISLTVRDENALGPLMNTVSAPLILLSGILLPLSLAPAWLQSVAAFNPFSWTVEGIRALFAGHPGDPSVWQGMLITGVLAALAVAFAARSFTRTVR